MSFFQHQGCNEIPGRKFVFKFLEAPNSFNEACDDNDISNDLNSVGKKNFLYENCVEKNYLLGVKIVLLDENCVDKNDLLDENVKRLLIWLWICWNFW